MFVENIFSRTRICVLFLTAACLFINYFSLAQTNPGLNNKVSNASVFASSSFSFKVINGKVEKIGFDEKDQKISSLISQALENFKDKEVKSIFVGEGHFAFLTNKGTVFEGESGNLRKSEGEVKIYEVEGLPKIKQLSLGRFHSIALDNKGNVYSWGNNKVGQLGGGTYSKNNKPRKIKDLHGIVSIAAGFHHNLAVSKSGEVWAWGFNDAGQLGDGTNQHRITPVKVKGLNNIIEVTATSHSMALGSDGSVWSWGNNGFGQLGDNSFMNKNTPVRVIDLPAIKEISCGLGHSLALDKSGNVWTWGNNMYGQLADGSYDNRSYPRRIFSDCIAITSGTNHSLFVKQDNSIWSSHNGFNNSFFDEENAHLFYLGDLMFSIDAMELIIVEE